MRYKRIVPFVCILIAVLLAVGCVLMYVNNAPFRWSRNLCDAIRLGETDKALQLIDTGIEKGYSLDTLSERPSFIWALLETTPLTPLQAACKHGNYSVAEKLLKEGAGVQPVDGGIAAEPILCVLQRSYSPNDKALIQLLLDNGAELCCDSGSNNTLVNAAYRAPRNFNAVPDPNTGYPYDETVAEGITEVFLLLAEHCNSNGVDDAGRTPLHCAALMKNWHLVRVLVAELDYAPDAKDINGKTAYDFAKESNAPEDVLELLQLR